MGAEHVVFLFDVDNTLIDNDHIVEDMKTNLERDIGNEQQTALLGIFRAAAHRARLRGLSRSAATLPRQSSARLRNYRGVVLPDELPFREPAVPLALDVIEHYKQYGETAILSDGDMIFQPLKIERSGLREAVDEKVMIYIHKEQELDDVKTRYPGGPLRAHRRQGADSRRGEENLGRDGDDGVPGQGHYASDAEEVAKYMTPDVTVDRIDQLRDYDLARLRAATKG